MSNFSKRAVRWAAPVALVGTLGFAACSDDGDGEAITVATPSGINGSDHHLNNQADELARRSAGAGSDNHLYIQAEEIARRSAGAGSDNHLYIRAEEIARRVRADP